MYRHFHICTQSDFISGKYTFDQPVKSCCFKFFSVWLQSNPAVIVKNIRLFSILMDNLYKFFPKRCHKLMNKFHPVSLLFCCRHMSHLIFSLIHKVLCCQRISIFFFKLFQSKWTYRKIIGAPITEETSVSFITSPYPRKVIEQRRKSYNGCFLMTGAPVF